MRAVARLSSLALTAAFSLLIALTLGNEDPVQPPGIPVVILMGVAIAGCAAAWRWVRAGGAVLIVTSVALAVAALSAANAFGIGPEGVIIAAMYSLAVLGVGLLFAASGGKEGRAGEG